MLTYKLPCGCEVHADPEGVLAVWKSQCDKHSDKKLTNDEIERKIRMYYFRTYKTTDEAVLKSRLDMLKKLDIFDIIRSML
jgi:hypothetical protein